MDVTKIRGMDSLLGTVLFPFMSPFRRIKLDRDPKSILLIQLWGIGETILLLPMMKSLRAIFPKARISVLCTDRNKDVFFQNPHINEVIPLKPSAWEMLGFIPNHLNGYDLAIDCEEYLNIATLTAFLCGKTSLGYDTRHRGRMHTKSIPYNDRQHCAETFMDLARVFKKIPKIEKLEPLRSGQRDIAGVGAMMKEHGLKKKGFIIIAPSVAESSKSRVWPKERFVELTKKLLKRKIVFVGGPDDVEQVRAITRHFKGKIIDLSGRMSLRELFVLTAHASLVISNDSGTMHIGAAQHVPTIGLFGPNAPTRFGPFGKKNVSIYHRQSCDLSPCINIHKGQVPDCLYGKDSKDYQKCMKAIEMEEVFMAAKRLLT